MSDITVTDCVLGDLDPYCRNHRLMYKGQGIAIVQNAVGHCCGVTFMGCLNGQALKRPEVIQEVIQYYRDLRKNHKTVQNTLFYIKNLNFYLSEETAHWHSEIKKVAKQVHSFRNGHNTVEQWVITVWDDVIDGIM